MKGGRVFDTAIPSRMITGTKVQVWNGTADRTPGGLTRADLVKNKRGRIVSRAKHDAAKALHPNGPPTTEMRQGGFLQFLAPIMGSLLGSILTPSSGSGLGSGLGSGSGSGLGRAHLATASSHLEAAMRAGRVTPEQIRRAAATVMAHRGRGAGLLSLLGIKTPLADIPIIGSILG